MGTFYLHQILRSLGSAAILLLNDIDPWEGYIALTNDSFRTSQRLSYTYKDQTFVMTYGPMGTITLPGIVIEGGTAMETYNEKHQMPIIFSVSREIQNSPELDLQYLDEMCLKLDGMLRRDNAAPVYSFGDGGDEIMQIVGKISWATNAILGLPLFTKYVGVPEAGGWMRKEYHFTCTFHMKFPM